MKGNRNSNNSGNRDGVMVAAGKNIVKRTPTPYNNRIQRINLQWNCKAMETRTFSMETKLWCENMRPAVTNYITTTLSKQTHKKIALNNWNEMKQEKNQQKQMQRLQIIEQLSAFIWPLCEKLHKISHVCG